MLAVALVADGVEGELRFGVAEEEIRGADGNVAWLVEAWAALLTLDVEAPTEEAGAVDAGIDEG